MAIEIVSWRFRNDDGSETTATWMAAERTNVSLPIIADVVRLRYEIQETVGVPDPNTYGYHLERDRNSTGYGLVADSPGNGGSPTVVGLALSANITDGEATTGQLTAGTGTFLAGQVREDSAGDIFGVGTGPGANQHTENEWVFALIPTDIVVGDTIDFRIVNSNDGVPITLGAGVSWPRATVIAAPTGEQQPISPRNIYSATRFGPF